MKILSHTICLIGLLIAACHSVPREVITSISGHIIHPKDQIVKYRFGGKILTDTLDAENKFTTLISIRKPAEITFMHGEERATIYLKPGDRLEVTFDMEQFDKTLTFSGSEVNENRYNAAMSLLRDTLISWDELFQLPEERFSMILDSIHKIKLKYLDSFEITDAGFRDFIRNELKYGAALCKMLYPDIRARSLTPDTFHVSAGYYDFARDIDLSDTTQIDIPYFMDFVDSWIRQLYNEKLRSGEMDESRPIEIAYIDVIKEVMSNPAVGEMMVFNKLPQLVTDLEPDERDGLIAEWKTLNPPAKHLAVIQELCDQLAKLTGGMDAPDFTGVSPSGDSISLSDFKGKLVYVDVWATWCGPCRAEHPYMEKLQERFKSTKDVVFIAVSIDNTPEPWKEMLEEKKMGGVNLFVPGAFDSEIIKKYLINGIPQFMLIDKEGKIIDVNAERPSGNIGDQLQELLINES